MKARLLQDGVTAYSSSRVGSADAVWDYMLTDPADIEDVFLVEISRELDQDGIGTSAPAS